MIRIRTKIEIILVVMFLVCVGIASVLSVNRTISDEKDDVITYIRNSEGNYWSTNESNLQLAIWDLNSTAGGSIILPSCEILISSSIDVISNVTITGQGNHTILQVNSCSLPNGIFNCVTPPGFISFRDLNFLGDTATGIVNGICFCTDDDMIGLTVDNCVFKNFSKTTSAGIAILPNSDDDASNVRITYCDFIDNLYGIRCEGDADPSLIRCSTISNNYFYENFYGINFEYVSHIMVLNNIFDGGTNGMWLCEAQNCSFINNMGYNLSMGIDEQCDTNYCSYMLNNFLNCVEGYDINGYNYKPYGETNFTAFNFGSWT